MKETKKSTGLTDIDYARAKKRTAIRKEQAKKIKKYIIILVILALSWIILEPKHFIYGAESYVKSFFSKATFPVKISGSSILKQDQINEKPIFVTDTELKILNAKGYPQLTVKHNFKNPKLVIKGDFFLLYDLGNQEFLGGTQYRASDVVSFSGAIQSAALSSDEKIAIVTNSEKYLNEVVVYKNNHEEIYRWLSASEYVVDVQFHPSNQQMIIQCVDGVGGTLTTTIYYIDLGQTKEVSKLVLEDYYPIEIMATQGYLRLIGENDIRDYNYKGELLRESRFGHEKLIDFKVRGNHILVVKSSGDNAYYNTIQLLDGNLVEFSSFDVGGTVLDADYKQNEIVILSSNRIKVYKSDGTMKKEKMVADGSQKVMKFNDKLLTFTKERIYEQEFTE